MSKPNGIGKQRDPNLDNGAVKLYREIVHLQLNHVQRSAVAIEVTNLRVWEAVLIEWMGEGRNPKNVFSIVRLYRGMTNGNGRA